MEEKETAFGKIEKDIERETSHAVFSSAGCSLDGKYDHPVNRQL